MFDIGTKEITIIAVVLLLLFGPKKIPEIAKTIIDAKKSIKKGFDDEPIQPVKSSDSEKIDVKVIKKK